MNENDVLIIMFLALVGVIAYELFRRYKRATDYERVSIVFDAVRIFLTNILIVYVLYLIVKCLWLLHKGKFR